MRTKVYYIPKETAASTPKNDSNNSTFGSEVFNLKR